MWPSVPKIIPEKQLGTAYALIFWVQNWGLMGVAWSRFALVAVGLVFFRISLGLIEMGWIHAWKMMGAPLFASLFMWFLLERVREWLPTPGVSDAVQLAKLIGIGVVSYIIVSLLVSRQHALVVKEVVFKLRRKS